MRERGVWLVHPITGGEFLARSQGQIDRLCDEDREGGAWEVAEEQGPAADNFADTHTKADLLALADAAGIEVPPRSSKAQIAALLSSVTPEV